MPGAYLLRFVDTWKGEDIGELQNLKIDEAKDGAAKGVILKCPAFRRDIAVIIERLR